ncbi:hypothetical protein LX36DRAFT_271338 [Colletotrichum falcatum]|nr:hypothetical protein LX36DRAFT_271338 [Colletotrichum falcatum]
MRLERPWSGLHLMMATLTLFGLEPLVFSSSLLSFPFRSTHLISPAIISVSDTYLYRMSTQVCMSNPGLRKLLFPGCLLTAPSTVTINRGSARPRTHRVWFHVQSETLRALSFCNADALRPISSHTQLNYTGRRSNITTSSLHPCRDCVSIVHHVAFRLASRQTNPMPSTAANQLSHRSHRQHLA